MARETVTVDPAGIEPDAVRGMTLAEALSGIARPARSDESSPSSAELLASLEHVVSHSQRDEMLGAAMAAAGLGITVHGPDGRLVLSNSISAALSLVAMLGVDTECDLLRSDGTILQPDDLPLHIAIATRRPVRRAIIGVRQHGMEPPIWLHVDAFPCIDRHGGDLVRVVSLWTVAVPIPAADSPARDSHGHPESVGRELFPEIDGTSPEIERLKHHMVQVAGDADVTVLILGESGTGKERVATAIHRASRRCRAPFVVVNCAGLSPTLVEDEIFGHVRGAFTGAVDDQPGPFERADGGTVFLDEIGELTSDLQTKLLRALQQRTVQRLGSRRETPFDVRVIAATHVDLARAKARGRFREDLYYRLKVYELRVPPLRRRGVADIRTLVQATMGRFAARKRRPMPALDPAVADLFDGYSWPGNIRELENTLERMIVAAGDDPWLRREHLPEEFDTRDGRQHQPFAAPGTVPSESPRTRPSVADVRAALERNGSRYGRTAAELGLSRHQLYRLLRRHDRPTRGRE
ncbi:MAG TPA: sigma-54 dependent transcriptional regulator [Vicinamibacterales bacterium]|nr:sigma-54 dependent transcriptional regulator [Vicinamibacterales bacterium]